MERLIIPTLATFIYIFGREVLKTVEDVSGDEMYGVSNIATCWGETRALWVGVISIVTALVLALFQYFLNINNIFFLIVDLLILTCQIILAFWLLLDYKTRLSIFLHFSALIMLAITISFSIGVIGRS